MNCETDVIAMSERSWTCVSYRADCLFRLQGPTTQFAGHAAHNYYNLLLLYRFVMRTMVDLKVESEAQIITLVDIKPIGLAA